MHVGFGMVGDDGSIAGRFVARVIFVTHEMEGKCIRMAKTASMTQLREMKCFKIIMLVVVLLTCNQ